MHINLISLINYNYKDTYKIKLLSKNLITKKYIKIIAIK